MMPQKRNPYFLEHVQGKSAAAVGAFTHATIACHAKPFTNAIAVGTEAMAPVLGALTETTHAVTLLRLVLAEIEVRPAAMRARAEEGLTAATELANRLVASGGMSFRAAHHQVGEIATAALTRGQRLEDAAADWRARTGAGVSLDGLDVASVVARTGHGGGPAPDTLATCLAGLRRTLRDHGARSRAMRRRWAHAAELSRAAAAEVRR
jgi:argininosuccinate lyase